MFNLKNAIKNIYRYKNKYIVFGILYFILILIASVSVNIFIQMGQSIDSINKESANVARFVGKIIGNSNVTEENSFATNISTSTRPTKDNILLQYADIDHIDDIKLFTYKFSTTYLKEDISELKKEIYVNGNIIFCDNSEYNSFFIEGYNTSLLYLVKDSFKLETGRLFENDNEVIIDKNRINPNMKEWNNLTLNDKIILRNDDDIHIEFTIVGITKQDSDDEVDTDRCRIYTTLESAEYFDIIAGKNETSYDTISREQRNNLIISGNSDKLRKYSIIMGYDALIFLDSSDNLGYVQNKMSDKGVHIAPFFSDFWVLTNLTGNMQTWSIIFIIFTSLIILFVTVISTIILLTNRKYEIAVLRSIGMKKSRLITNYLIENLFFIWGISILSLISAQFTSKIFTGNIFTDIEDLMSVETFEHLTQGINIELLLKNIGLIFIGTTIVIILTLIIVCINIIKFEPLKIFNKQY